MNIQQILIPSTETKARNPVSVPAAPFPWQGRHPVAAKPEREKPQPVSVPYRAARATEVLRHLSDDWQTLKEIAISADLTLDRTRDGLQWLRAEGKAVCSGIQGGVYLWRATK